VFKLPFEKRGSCLWEHHAEVIQSLNVDYFKPWFPVKKDGRVVDDFGDMTYRETVLRLVCLIYITTPTVDPIYLCTTSRETGCAVSKSISPA
jgi:enoyl reductase-like protein